MERPYVYGVAPAPRPPGPDLSAYLDTPRRQVEWREWGWSAPVRDLWSRGGVGVERVSHLPDPTEAVCGARTTAGGPSTVARVQHMTSLVTPSKTRASGVGTPYSTPALGRTACYTQKHLVTISGLRLGLLCAIIRVWGRDVRPPRTGDPK